ncbi:MAG TPA: energy transducer TonB [Bryobacteraceae bacterium]|nr:energy transducer TonB [Bryobacteraceae bacterium]
MTGASFSTVLGASRPQNTAPYPEASRPDTRGAVVLSLDIDETGRPVDVQVERYLDPILESDLTAAVKQWRFEPASKDGRPVTVHATLTFIHE